MVLNLVSFASFSRFEKVQAVRGKYFLRTQRAFWEFQGRQMPNRTIKMFDDPQFPAMSRGCTLTYDFYKKQTTTLMNGIEIVSLGNSLARLSQREPAALPIVGEALLVRVELDVVLPHCVKGFKRQFPLPGTRPSVSCQQLQNPLPAKRSLIPGRGDSVSAWQAPHRPLAVATTEQRKQFAGKKRGQ